MFTLGKLRREGFLPGKLTPATPPPDDPRLPTLTARLTRGSATAYALMGGTDEATRHLAEVHVRAGEPQSLTLTLAHHAIAGVSALQSVAARRERLIPLATALETRPSTDTRELARLARQVATTRI